MLKMDQVHVLRHKVLKEGQSIRRVARDLGLSPSTWTGSGSEHKVISSGTSMRTRLTTINIAVTPASPE
jgi:hypothetical protein